MVFPSEKNNGFPFFMRRIQAFWLVSRIDNKGKSYSQSVLACIQTLNPFSNILSLKSILMAYIPSGWERHIPSHFIKTKLVINCFLPHWGVDVEYTVRKRDTLLIAFLATWHLCILFRPGLSRIPINFQDCASISVSNIIHVSIFRCRGHISLAILRKVG